MPNKLHAPSHQEIDEQMLANKIRREEEKVRSKQRRKGRRKRNNKWEYLYGEEKETE